MKLNRAAFVASVILCSSSFLAAHGQTRRRPPRTKKQASVKIEPLTENQKKSVAELLREAEQIEVVYQYEPSRYYDESSALATRGKDIANVLPEGVIRNQVIGMVQAYSDAGYLYSVIYPHRETEQERMRRNMIEKLETLERHEGKIPSNSESYSDREARERSSWIAHIISSYGLENASPYQARQYIFSRAQISRDTLNLCFGRFLQPRSRQQPGYNEPPTTTS
jgi:hypothetical protein